MVELGRVSRCRSLLAVAVAAVAAAMVSLCVLPPLALGEDATPLQTNSSADSGAQIVHFSGADFTVPEAWRGRVEPRVRNLNPVEEYVSYRNGALLGWDPTMADHLDQWRDNWRPMDYGDICDETLPDGTVLIFGGGNDFSCTVEIKDPQGREGCLTTFADPSIFMTSMSKSDMAAFHRLQAETAGVPESTSNRDTAIAFLRECAKRLTITLPPTETPEDRVRQMHRLYNPYTGEHFYTASESERDNLTAAGWSYEGVGWTAPAWGDMVYRLYNPYAGDHHYTASSDERDLLTAAGWKYEGIGWRSGGNVPVLRQYNPFAATATHNYTTSEGERDMLLSAGWVDEGVGWYGV